MWTASAPPPSRLQTTTTQRQQMRHVASMRLVCARRAKQMHRCHCHDHPVLRHSPIYANIPQSRTMIGDNLRNNAPSTPSALGYKTCHMHGNNAGCKRVGSYRASDRALTNACGPRRHNKTISPSSAAAADIVNTPFCPATLFLTNSLRQSRLRTVRLHYLSTR